MREPSSGRQLHIGLVALLAAAAGAGCTTQRVGVATAAAAPDHALVGEPVAFTCTFTGGEVGTTFRWEFGDGARSDVQNPTHPYDKPGKFSATCVATAGSVSGSASASVDVTADSEPSLTVEADPRAGLTPLDVKFSSFADGGNAPLAYHWTFGDGATSTEASPVHTYTAAGSFTAQLQVTDADADSANARVSISVGDGNLPAVTVTPASAAGLAPLLVRFTCSAAGGNPPYRYAWSFGDGVASTTQNPAYTYTRPGQFVATCSATDRFDQTGEGSADIVAEDPDRPPVIDGIAADNGVPDADPLCAAAGQTEVRFTAAVHDGNDPPTGLRFSWTFESIPLESQAAFSRTDLPSTSFVPDRVGDYTLRFWATNERGKTASRAVTVKSQGMSAIRFLNPEPLAAGSAGADYPDTLRVRTETACAVPYSGGAIGWSASNAKIARSDTYSDGTSIATADIALGCGVSAPASVLAVPVERVRVEFTRLNYGTNLDCIEPEVCLTRGSQGPVFNRGSDPVEWACGRCGEETTPFVANLRDLRDNCAAGSLRYLPGRYTCLKLPKSGAEWDVLWTSWTANHFGGGFSYVRERLAPLPLEGPGAGVSDLLQIAIVPGPATLLRLEPERDVPVVDAAGNKVGMVVSARVADHCGNPRTTPEVTFDVSVGEPRMDVVFDRTSGSQEDCFEPGVCLTRGSGGPVYNSGASTIEWACGACGEETTEYVTDLGGLRDNCADGSLSQLPGRTTCLHVVDSNASWNIAWTGWAAGGGSSSGTASGFSYVRSGIPPGNAGACFDDLCVDDGGSGVDSRTGVATSGGAATLHVYSRRAGWIGFAVGGLSPSLGSGGWTVHQNRIHHFEDGPSDFDTFTEGNYASDWALGAPGGASGAHSGTRAWATGLAGNYRAAAGADTEEARYLHARLSMPCPEDESAPIRLSYWEFHDLASGALAYVAAGSAFGDLLTSPDGSAPYDGLLGTRVGYQGTSTAWRQVKLDADAYRCTDLDAYWTLYLANAVQTGDGWTVDDVSVEYLGSRPNASFVGGPARDGAVSAVRDGVAACATSPAVVNVAAQDAYGNDAYRADLVLSAAGAQNARFIGASPGRLTTATGANATVESGLLGRTDVELLADAPGTATVTFKAPAGDVSGDVAFIAATANETGLCEDGRDDDCDGKPDCADPDCAQVLACQCFDGSDRTRAARSCLALREDCSITRNGTYWLDPNGASTSDAFEAYCDLTAPDGPWTLVALIKKSDNQAHFTTAAVGSGAVDFQGSSTEKFSDQRINAIRATNAYTGTTDFKFTCFENNTSDNGCPVKTMYCSSQCNFDATASCGGGPCSLCSHGYEGPLTQLQPNTGTRGLGHHHENADWFAYQRHPEEGNNSGCRSDSCGGGDGHLWAK